MTVAVEGLNTGALEEEDDEDICGVSSLIFFARLPVVTLSDSEDTAIESLSSEEVLVLLSAMFLLCLICYMKGERIMLINYHANNKPQ